MQKLTSFEILEKLKTFADSEPENIAWGGISELGLGAYFYVELHLGEGGGEDWSAIYHFKDHDVYIMISGTYLSHVGTEFYGSWDDHVYEVWPNLVLKTEYETTKQTLGDLRTLQNDLDAKVDAIIDKFLNS